MCLLSVRIRKSLISLNMKNATIRGRTNNFISDLGRYIFIEKVMTEKSSAEMRILLSTKKVAFVVKEIPTAH